MARTESNPVSFDTSMPNFALPNVVSGEVFASASIPSDHCVVVMFICNHCPFVMHINEGLVAFAKDNAEKPVSIVAISSNDVVNYPQDSPDKMKALATELGYPFPYLYDADQSVAKAFDAACTPDFYVYNKDRKLTYHGQFCMSRPGNYAPVTGLDLRHAVDVALATGAVIPDQKPSVGCNIKWLKD